MDLAPLTTFGSHSTPCPAGRASGRSAEHPSRPPRLDASQLQAEQARTLATPRLHYDVASRLLFALINLLYGRRPSVAKFKVLELVARVPYQAWERAAYIAVTHVHARTDFARRIFERIEQSRAQQDNEQWHLLILEDLCQREGIKRSLFWHRLVPQGLAFVYYQLSWLLFVVKPAWSYRLNANFEDHAEHEYMSFVADHPEIEHEACQHSFETEYGRFESLADLFRQIGHDERTHKLESVAAIASARFR